MVTKILDHLYLGDIHDAQKFEGTIICVMQELVSALEPEKAYWIPIIRTRGKLNNDELIEEQDVEVVALKHQLELVCDIINKNTDQGKDTLIHCMASIERSPLTVIYYLHKHKNMGYNEAYEYVKKIHPITANRLSWLNLSYDEATS